MVATYANKRYTNTGDSKICTFLDMIRNHGWKVPTGNGEDLMCRRGGLTLQVAGEKVRLVLGLSLTGQTSWRISIKRMRVPGDRPWVDMGFRDQWERDSRSSELIDDRPGSTALGPP